MFITEDGQIQSRISETYQIETKKSKKKKEKKQKNKKPKKHPKLRKFIKTVFILLFILFLLLIAAGGYAAYQIYNIAKDAKLNKNDLIIKYENSVVKDIKGNTLGVLNGSENRQSIPITQMPEYLPKAFIAIEDERFYEHKGVDIKRTARATYTYLSSKGNSPFGGSTITQQLVKNLTQEKDDTWQRKVREMARAYYVEQDMSKDEILELYLNVIFLGDTVYGVQKGANYYFNKNASDLSLAECAFLAGINHSPNSYAPFAEDNGQSMLVIKNRTKTVLQKMHDLGYIKTEQEYRLAIDEVNRGLKFERGAFPQTVFSYHTDAAINQIISKLQKMHEWTYEQAKIYLFSGGFTIYTTEDPDLSAVLEDELRQEKYYRADYDIYGNLQPTQASMVLIDNQTGYVAAIANGFEQKTDAFGFNIAVDAKKQTGSSMKPIAVLAPSIDKGIITAATVFDDSPTTFNNGTYSPKDYNNYRGLVTVREAIATSQNIPMVKAMTLLTPDESINFLKNAGITSIKDNVDNVLALALGGLTWGVTPVEMAGAYATIANGGKYREPAFFTKVVDSAGNVIVEADTTERQVMSEAAAFVTKQILTQPVKTGTAQNCAIPNIDVAAKTGTTNDDYDRWLCGFTPYYTATVWYGHNTNATVSGWNLSPASQIWSGAMLRIHNGLEAKSFMDTRPENVVEVEVCNKSGFLATNTCRRSGCAYTEYFVKGTEPVQTCPYHSSAKICTQSGLLANPNCPKTRSVYSRGELIGNSSLWQTKSSYYKSNNVPMQVCTMH